MWKASRSCLCLLLVAVSVYGDIYLHNPRGCNNRLNENSKARRNANRLFDSQNNNNGGYNVGDATDRASGGDANKQYQMKYFMSGEDKLESASILTIEWTNQHGCGGTASNLRKTNCNLVIQAMCQPNDDTVESRDKIRAGISTGTQRFSYQARQFRSIAEQQRRKNGNVDKNKGLNEPWEFYDRCIHRENNKGLFLADQKLNKIGKYSRAIHTRQNNNGQRRGYECPEERDYYPYWHPTPWLDVAILTDNDKDCATFRNASFNRKEYYECAEEITDGRECQWIRRSRWNNKRECEANSGKWLAFYSYLEKLPQYKTYESCEAAAKASKKLYKWGLPHDTNNITKSECLVVPDLPACSKSPYSRVNHLGNGLSGKANSFNWILPHFPSGKEHRCVLRMRYNITTDDYDPKKVDASHNGQHVTNDPEVNFAGVPLQLAINTAQFGRTFQDRSHPFIIRKRPAAVKEGRIHNLNVRGKRGNIVQVYPAVEYDFTPNLNWIKSSDMVHIQWTGSNTNPGNNDGEGRKGTDRSNFLQMNKLGESYPTPGEKTNIWNGTEIVWIHHNEKVTPDDLAIDMASAGYYNCLKAKGCPKEIAKNAVGVKAKMQDQLDNAPASYEGALLKFKKGLYYYMCTRNNNFTNRSQKGILRVD